MSELACPGAQPAAEVAEILDTAGISYLSFGWLPVALLALDLKYGEVEIVVRDRDLVAAREELVNNGFRLCEKPDCRELLDNRSPPLQDSQRGVPFEDQVFTVAEFIAFRARNKYHLIAAAHFHLETQYDNCTVLSLYKKSSILRWIPVLEDDPRNDEAGLIWRSDDDARLPPARVDGPSGPWTGLHAVRFLNPASFCEALLLLSCRDYCHIRAREFSWRGMWETLIENQVRLNRPLRPDLKLIWDAAEAYFIHNDRSKAPAPLMSRIRRQLIANGVIVPAEIPEVVEWWMHQ
ncbi:hypothetical protein HK57_00614 [Aspergillus ustus]|uniref:Uncharacterized protein n=1 Tax=Aspergillus ustus TaxID=40382 RepID=A0A0C1C3K2_ASPUT|nr:hypothetical protein HK57_00614 [Aspergillus ustus]